MICEKCIDEGHYWFADDDAEISKELEEPIGLYAQCDMRRVFDTRTECECGCHGNSGIGEQEEGDEIEMPYSSSIERKEQEVSNEKSYGV